FPYSCRPSQDCQGVRPHDTAGSTCRRRQGDRIECNLLHCICPLLAQSGHVEPKFAMSAFGGKADMAYLTACCFDPKPTNARWWQHRRGWQRPPDSERCKMGARNALIRKRFYKKRDCKKTR